MNHDKINYKHKNKHKTRNHTQKYNKLQFFLTISLVN